MSSVLQHFDARRCDFAPYGFTCEIWEPQRMSRPDRHDEIEINYLPHGELTYMMGGHRVTMPPQQVSIFWAAIPHQIIEFKDVEHYYVLTVPFGEALQWGLPKSLITELLLGNTISETSAEYCLDNQLFQQWHTDLSDDSSVDSEIIALEVRARLMRLASHVLRLENKPLSSLSHLGVPKSHLEIAEKMACYIAQNYTSTIRCTDIAAHVGFHPDYATNIFKKVFGTTVVALITQHRVAHAQRQLITTRESILDIAHQSGFETLSRFNAAFKQMVGTTPREFRNTCS